MMWPEPAAIHASLLFLFLWHHSHSDSEALGRLWDMLELPFRHVEFHSLTYVWTRVLVPLDAHCCWGGAHTRSRHANIGLRMHVQCCDMHPWAVRLPKALRSALA